MNQQIILIASFIFPARKLPTWKTASGCRQERNLLPEIRGTGIKVLFSFSF